MTQGLAKYHARSPRYILNTQDDSLVRVAGPQQIPWDEGTEIRNVSLTGLAFTAPEDLCPNLGEVIRIQFAIPGSEQMACYGIVTRLDPESHERILVGIHFYKLDMAHRIVLAQGLSTRFRNPNHNDPSRLVTGFDEWYMILPHSFILAFLLSLWSWTMVAIIHFGYAGLIKELSLFFR
ncbi:MAG: PilZ domain-containing protein [Bdellovibrionaceae bacterium]|nr:PilZ domain-containing protein [Pseudobdellovibrionaceae bacterium]